MINQVLLACPADSEDTLRDLYAGVLGFQEVAKPPELAARGEGPHGNRLEFLEPLDDG